MFVRKESDKGRFRPASRVFWAVAWLAQAALWVFTLFLIADYWLYELPATKNYYAAGLEQGFDGLAGIVAALDPTWEEARQVKGYRIPSRLNRLQAQAVFHVWLEQDELPAWNAGLAGLKFDQQGKLLWVRRYYTAEPPVYAGFGDKSFSVVKPRLDLRQGPQGGTP